MPHTYMADADLAYVVRLARGEPPTEYKMMAAAEAFLRPSDACRTCAVTNRNALEDVEGFLAAATFFDRSTGYIQVMASISIRS